MSKIFQDWHLVSPGKSCSSCLTSASELGEMTGVINREHPDKPIIAQLKPRNPTIRTRDPHGLQFRRIQRPHQVQRQNAYRARVTEHGDLAAPMLLDDLVKPLPRAIE